MREVRLIATDGVFSMDGIIANLPALCELAQRHDAAVLVDDNPAVGVMGRRGAGAHEHHGVEDRIDLLTGTFGKALGGAAGGYVAGRRTLIELLRQRARPYLFSNALPPPICAATLAARSTCWRPSPACSNRCMTMPAISAPRWKARVPACRRRSSDRAGDDRGRPACHPNGVAARIARHLRDGVLLSGRAAGRIPHSHPMSAAHSRKDLDRAIEAFTTVGRELGVPA